MPPLTVYTGVGDTLLPALCGYGVCGTAPSLMGWLWAWLSMPASLVNRPRQQLNRAPVLSKSSLGAVLGTVDTGWRCFYGPG